MLIIASSRYSTKFTNCPFGKFPIRKISQTTDPLDVCQVLPVNSCLNGFKILILLYSFLADYFGAVVTHYNPFDF